MTAERLASEGAMVFLAGHDDESHFAVAAEACRKQGSDVRVAWGNYDFRETGAAERMVEDAVRELGRVDFLVNNAAIRIRHAFGEFSYKDFDDIVAVNLRAALFASQAVLPHMRLQGGGRIVNVASQMAQIAEDGSTLYGLTKAALIHLTKSMAFELIREDIIVNAVSPGPTMTVYNVDRTTANPQLKAAKIGHSPSARYSEPAEIAEAIVFLLGTTATNIIGHDLVVDGGYTIQ